MVARIVDGAPYRVGGTFEDRAMKVTIDIDLTPDEARRALGMPDLSPIHERYVAMMLDTMAGNALKPEMIEGLMKSWSPMGEAGLAMWRRLLESGSKPG